MQGNCREKEVFSILLLLLLLFLRTIKTYWVSEIFEIVCVPSGKGLSRVIKMKKLLFSFLIVTGIVLLFSGCVVVTITEDLQNPFLITMTWDGETLEPDDTGQLPVQTLDEEGAVVEATVIDEYGDPVFCATYEWYLNGELIEDGKDKSFDLSGTLEIGSYCLDFIVKKDTILSSEHVEFIKVE
jgi:hypothetical protein